ncbi:hypothetical protein BSKO_00229 [Bryopsis sp. KO-2023]|nr:hypothetical protein BSKO_00229 [Bryopsis sp. KO-2023]
MAFVEGTRAALESSAGPPTTYQGWELPPPGRHDMLPFSLTFTDSRTEGEFETLWRREAVARDRDFLGVLEVFTGLAMVRVLLQGAGWEYILAIGVALVLVLTSHGIRRVLGDNGVSRWRVTIVMIERSIATILHSYSAVRLGRIHDASWFEFLMLFLNISGIATQTTTALGLGLKFLYFPLHFLGILWYFFFFANDTCTIIMQESISETLVTIVDFISKCCSLVLGCWGPPQSFTTDHQEYYPCQHLFVGLHLIFGLCLTGFVIWEMERRGRERFLAEKAARGESIDQKLPPLFENLGYPGCVAVSVLVPPFFVSIVWFVGGASGNLIARYGLKLL